MQLLNHHQLSRAQLDIINSDSFYACCHSDLTLSLGFIKFQSMYHGTSFSNHSLYLLDNERLLGYVPAWSRSLEEISVFGRPSSLFIRSDDKNSDAKGVIMKKLAEVLSLPGSSCHINYDPHLATELYDRTLPYVEQEGLIDLTLSEDEILRNVRSSYRSLINWGKKNLNIKIFDESSVTEADFQKLIDLHIKSAGKLTRDLGTWKIQYDMIKSGEAYLLVAEYENSPVTAIYTLKDSAKAFYAVGASDRSLMEKNLPLSHWPIICSAFHAKSLGLTSYSMGVFNEVHLTRDPKWDNIIKFKKGFCSLIQANVLLKVKG